MSMVVKNNIPAVYGLGTLNRNSTALSKSLEKVSTGMKINSAADDNSAWSISERMRVRIRGLDQADQNTQNGRSLLKVAEGAVQSTVDILKTLKEKAINAANDTNTDADRQTIQKELNQSIDQIDDNANVTYNGKILMDGSKNTIGSATYTTLTNSSLSTDTTAGTFLTALKDRGGSGLNIVSTDKVTVSYVQGGKTYSTTYTVGNNSIQSILQKAENIDTSSRVFGSNDNRSVAAAKGITDDAAMQARAAELQAAVDSAAADLATKRSTADSKRGDVENAQTAVNTANQNIATYNLLTSQATTQLNTLGNAVHGLTPNDGNFLNYGGSTMNLTAINGFKSDYDSWRNSTGSGNTPDLSTWTSGYKTTFFNARNDFQNVASANAVYEAYDAYDATYNGLVALGSLSDLNTAKANAETALTNAQGEYNSAQSALTAAQIAYDTAVNNQAAEFGAQLLYEDKIGLEKSGKLLETVDGKNALTITAGTSGINGQISGFSVRITDSEGNVKTAANAALDAFSETIRAENASEDNALTLHVGADPGVAINLGMTDMRSEALGLKGSDGTKLDISTQERANAAISVLDNAIQKALNQQADIGNIASRLEYTSANLRVASDNVQASESTIRDADMAKEMTAYTKNNVLLSASQSMLSQANQNSMDVMTLLQ